MFKRFSIAFVLVLLLGAIVLLGLTVQNDGCPPWQERVGYGDGVFGEGQDFSRCR